MAVLAQRTPTIPSHFAIRHNGWIMLGYAAFALIALAAIYFASGGPGTTEANLAIAAALP